MLQVVLSLNPGGTERLVVDIVKRLQAEIAMAVCCLDDVGAWAGELQEYDVPVTSLHRNEGFHPGLGLAIADAAKRHGAAVIHCHHYSPFVYSCLSRLWRPASRVIFTEHGRLNAGPPSTKRRFANSMLRHVPHEVFTVSEDLRHHLIAEGFNHSDVSVIYNGINVGRLPDAGARARTRTLLGAEGRVVFGTIARLDPVKDLETLIRAFAALPAEALATLVVIGDGPEESKLTRLALESGRGCHIHFLGHRGDARDLLAGCDVYVNTSINEGISLTILEAMAAGVPVVATAVGGTPEVIDDRRGRLVPPRDPVSLARALAELAGNPALRAQLGRCGRLHVESRFTLERMVSEYRDAYYRVAA